MVLVVLALFSFAPVLVLRATLLLGVSFIVVRLVSTLLVVGETSTGIAIALASASRVRSLLPNVERPPSRWDAGVLLELCPVSFVGGGVLTEDLTASVLSCGVVIS